MRKFILTIALVVISNSTYAFSCLPPDFNSDPHECNDKYFTMDDVENTIHGLKSLSPEGKDFILKEIHLKWKGVSLNLNLRVFSEELCEKSEKQGVNLFKNSGMCPVEVLSYSLYPEDDLKRLSGSFDVEITIGPDGRPNGGKIGGHLNF